MCKWVMSQQGIRFHFYLLNTIQIKLFNTTLLTQVQRRRSTTSLTSSHLYPHPPAPVRPYPHDRWGTAPRPAPPCWGPSVGTRCPPCCSPPSGPCTSASRLTHPSATWASPPPTPPLRRVRGGGGAVASHRLFIEPSHTFSHWSGPQHEECPAMGWPLG